MENYNKSYYAIIPASVRYDNRLCANAKLLYGEITALSNEKGYCWASNRYFANLYNVSEKSVSTWISQLVEYGHILREITYKEGTKQIENRFLRIVKSYPIGENSYSIEKNFHTSMEEKVIVNNTNNNNIYTPESKNLPVDEEHIDNPIMEDSISAREDEEMSKHDFEILYGLYPKKEGKMKAYLTYKQWIKGRKVGTDTIKLTNQQMYKAIENYNRFCEENKREFKYIKQASTFFNNILDFIDD